MVHLRAFHFRRSVDPSAPHLFKMPKVGPLNPERDGLTTALVVARRSDAHQSLRQERCAVKGCGKWRDDPIHSS